MTGQSSTFQAFPTAKLRTVFPCLAILGLALLLAMVSPSRGQGSVCLRGVNISGAEFGGPDGKAGTDYTYPSDATLDWAAARNMAAIRLPFRWERLQPRLNGALDQDELSRLKDTVERANRRGLTVILDLHNYAEYRGEKIGQKTDKGNVPPEALADFWRRLASEFSGNEKAVYGLMNEPAGVTAQSWFEAAQAAVTAIRRTGADNLVLVPGTIWSGASHWFEEQDGGSNADLFERLSDPANRFAFEFHQYMDEDFSGTKADCPRVSDAVAALSSVTEWLRQHDFKGFLGEFGGTSAPDCLSGLMEMAGFVNQNRDVWIGWTAWAAGDWWGDYPLSLQPVGRIDRPQFKVLEPFLAGGIGCGRP